MWLRPALQGPRQHQEGSMLLSVAAPITYTVQTEHTLHIHERLCSVYGRDINQSRVVMQPENFHCPGPTSYALAWETQVRAPTSVF